MVLQKNQTKSRRIVFYFAKTNISMKVILKLVDVMFFLYCPFHFVCQKIVEFFVSALDGAICMLIWVDLKNSAYAPLHVRPPPKLHFSTSKRSCFKIKTCSPFKTSQATFLSGFILSKCCWLLCNSGVPPLPKKFRHRPKWNWT